MGVFPVKFDAGASGVHQTGLEKRLAEKLEYACPVPHPAGSEVALHPGAWLMETTATDGANSDQSCQLTQGL
jgi:hypothetical protein